MNEHALYGPICRGAALHGWLLIPIEDAGRQKRPADLFGLTPSGRGVLVEVKLGAHDLEKHQTYWLDAWAGTGGLALLMRAVPPEVCVYEYQDGLLHDAGRLRLALGRTTGWKSLRFQQGENP